MGLDLFCCCKYYQADIWVGGKESFLAFTMQTHLGELPINLGDVGLADKSQCQFCMHAAMRSLAVVLPGASEAIAANQ